MLKSWNWIALVMVGTIVLTGGIVLAVFVGGRISGAPIGLGVAALLLGFTKRFGSPRFQAKMRGEDPDSDAHPGPSLQIPDREDRADPRVFEVPAPRPSKLFNEKGQANGLFYEIVLTSFAVLTSLGAGIWFAVDLNLWGGLVIVAFGLALTTMYVLRFVRLLRKPDREVAPDG